MPSRVDGSSTLLRSQVFDLCRALDEPMNLYHFHKGQYLRPPADSDDAGNDAGNDFCDVDASNEPESNARGTTGYECDQRPKLPWDIRTILNRAGNKCTSNTTPGQLN